MVSHRTQLFSPSDSSYSSSPSIWSHLLNVVGCASDIAIEGSPIHAIPLSPSASAQILPNPFPLGDALLYLRWLFRLATFIMLTLVPTG